MHIVFLHSKRFALYIQKTIFLVLFIDRKVFMLYNILCRKTKVNGTGFETKRKVVLKPP